MPQVAPFFVIKSHLVPFFIVTWPPNLMSSDRFKGISGPDSDEKLAPNIIDKYMRSQTRAILGLECSYVLISISPSSSRIRDCSDHHA
jgi:hypothetical protein